MYKLNLELTQKLYQDKSIKNMVKLKECYSNQYRVCNFSSLRSKYTSGEYKVALSYVNVGLGIWIRHCITVTDKNEIIDLTAMTYSTFDEESVREYDIVKVFDYEEYNKLVEGAYDEVEETYRCDLPNLKEEYDFYKSRKDKDMFYQVSEYDFFTYILPLLKKYELFTD